MNQVEFIQQQRERFVKQAETAYADELKRSDELIDSVLAQERDKHLQRMDMLEKALEAESKRFETQVASIEDSRKDFMDKADTAREKRLEEIKQSF